MRIFAGAEKHQVNRKDKVAFQPGNKAGSATEKDNTENKESDKEAGKEADAVTYTCPEAGGYWVAADAATARLS